MVKLKNNRPRLITINIPNSEKKKITESNLLNVTSYDLIPNGPAVSLPDVALKIGFVQALIDQGDITVIEAPREKPKKKSKSELIAEALDMGIDVDEKATVPQIEAQIEAESKVDDND